MKKNVLSGFLQPERMKLTGLILLGAAGYFLGHANQWVQAPILVLLTPFSLFICSVYAPNGKAAFLYGWLIASIGLSATLYWLYYPIHDVGGLPLPLVVPCITLLGCYLGVYTGLSALCLHQLTSVLSWSNSFSFGKTIAVTIIGGAAFAGCEVLAGTLFTGFPWYNLGSAFAVWPAWAQAASTVGSYGLSACYTTTGFLLAACFVIKGPKKILPGACAILVLISLPLYGYQRMRPSLSNNLETIHVGLVQGNIDQNQKWVPAFIQTTINVYTGLSLQLIAEHQAEHSDQPLNLIVWPETAMPFGFNVYPDFALQLQRFSAKVKTPILFGTMGYYPQGNSQYPLLFNRLQALSATGEDAGYYDKQHLVPFGEYIPFSFSLPFLDNISQGIDFTAGHINAPLQISVNTASSSQSLTAVPSVKHLAIGPLICYEVIFPDLAQARVRSGANLLLTISNDAWFGDTSAPWQHLGLAAMRSIEQQRPMIRATNTGVTAVIDAYGRVTTFGSLYESGVFCATVTPESTLTIYNKSGYLLPPLLMLITALCLISRVTVSFLRGNR